MTREQAEALGRRALEAGFVWAAGVQVLGRAFGSKVGNRLVSKWDYAQSNAVPDFRDPATLGILVAQVRERWGDPRLYARPIDGYPHPAKHSPGWGIIGDDEHGRCFSPGDGAVEAEAWGAALEAAP